MASRRQDRAPPIAIADEPLGTASQLRSPLLSDHCLEIVPTSVPPAPAPAVGVCDITEQGLPQAFARAYVSCDARRPDQHRRQVAAFLSETLDGARSLQMPPRGEQRVVWTAAIRDQADAHGDRVITVAAQTTRQLMYLAVPVHQTERGFLVVPRYPALE